MPPDQNSKANSTTQEPTKLARTEYTCALWNYNYRRNHRPIKGNSECWKKEEKRKGKERNRKQKRNTSIKQSAKGLGRTWPLLPYRTLYKCTVAWTVIQLCPILSTRCSSWLFHLVAYVPWIGVRDGSTAIPKWLPVDYLCRRYISQLVPSLDKHL